MKMRSSVFFAAPLLLFLLVARPASAASTASGPLILISIDGFRWDYLTKYPTPTLSKLAADGVHAKRLISSFPTKTFPNHYTIVTGLRPEHHGIVSNYFYDPALKAAFNKGQPADNADPRWWSEGEPIWITAEKQDLRTACFFWPGSQASVQGLRPTYYESYHGKINSNDNVDALLKQLDQPAAIRPKFCALYFDVVDRMGHKFGPDAPETGAAVQEVDTAIARLLDGLAKRGLRETTNFVIVSDHGMTPVSPQRVIFLEDMMPLSTVQVESYGPNGGVRPKTGTAAELVASIRAKHLPHLQVYLREKVPAHFHYRDNPRIPPVVLIADEGWNIETKAGWPALAARYDRGSHGYDPALSDMGALFIADGPAFNPHVKISKVENIHLYNLLCAVLGLKPAPNDGDQRLVREALKR
ncbi:MAG: nucleotide pyrophosphatase/phosphodiesterase family protein [Lacunisphaera sp.]